MKRSFIFSAVLALGAPLYAGQLDSKFDSIVKQFSRDAAARGLTAPAAAVFPYSCDEKLAAKRVDLAVSELLTARLQRDGSLRLVERSQLETVMKEQALGLSGAMDSAAAAQVGKLAGARAAVLGTVARVGKSYQISSKLVDTETAEIISASIVEVPLETFDAEAARYLVLVPEREALGLYLGFMYAPLKTKTLPAISVPNSGAPNKILTPQPQDTAFWGINVGIRYQAAKRWYADLSVFPALTMGSAAKFTVEGQTVNPPTGTLDGEGAKLSVNRVSQLSRKFRALYGLGYQVYGIQPYQGGGGDVPAGTTNIRRPNGGSTLYGPFARAGLEFRPSERFALNLFGQAQQSDTMTIEWTENISKQKLKVMELDLPPFIAEADLTFYF